MAKTVEEKMISDAIKGTEQEIFSDATGAEGSDTDAGEKGDTSLEEMGEGLEGQQEDDAGADDDAADEDAGDGDEAEPERDPKTGQFKPKAEGDKAAAKPEGDKVAAKPDGKAQQQAQPDPNGRVPAGRLREESAKREAAEAARVEAEAKATKLETDVGALSKRLDDLLTAIATGKLSAQPQQQPAPKAEEEQVPDIFSDPEGYQRYMQNMVQRTALGGQQQLETLRVELSMQNAHDKHGADFEEAYKAVTSLDKNDPNARQTVQRIWASPNPGRALVAWHNQVKTLREVGDNPAAYREKVEKDTRDKLLNDPDFIKTVMEKLRGEAENGGGNGKPRTVTRLAPSLNGARGGAMGQLTDRRPQDGSEAGVFASAFED